MNIDFPLILMILVVGSGVIWLLDSLIAAGPRRERVAALRARFPAWDQPDSGDARQFAEAARRDASEPAIVEYARSFFPVLAAVFVLRSFLFEPFQIPSSSMEPTLDVGDYILVNKFTWGVRLPVFRTKMLDVGAPERGDVIVFFPPHQNDTYYIKRVVGLPGDEVRYVGKRLFINGEPVPVRADAVAGDTRGAELVGRERLGDEEHLMQVDARRRGQDFVVTVKPGHYFLMGDNRDNSSDSRVWGQVPERDIVGKAIAVWMHWDSFFSIPSFARASWIR